ncbi:M15 family metallopeptidase [Deinococcus sonorensis]|uniref:M15 family metallopeptidase n=2 Tax=Deinococcus sonorensis TaxID=309891 RepID=A0AAU7U6A6_9DEIO
MNDRPAPPPTRQTKPAVFAALAGGCLLLMGAAGRRAPATGLILAAAPGFSAPVTLPAPGPPVSGTAAAPAAIDTADGVLPDGVTVFNRALPGVTNLAPHLLAALRQAASDAAGDRVDLFVNSGWRSPRYQRQLMGEAVATYGSAREAARWVASPETSAHVSGDAVDIGPPRAAAWLNAHGARYGLCRVYRNEPWHYEWRRSAPVSGCPPLYPDPTRDPRLRPPGAVR